MTTAIDRVEQLLALAANEGASEEEARTAAVQAARLIRRHGLRVVDHDARSPAAFRVTIEQVQQWEHCNACGAVISKGSSCRVCAVRAAEEERYRHGDAPEDRRNRRDAGICGICRKYIREDERSLLFGYGLVHKACAASAEHASTSATPASSPPTRKTQRSSRGARGKR
jgi:hypothetical protein